MNRKYIDIVISIFFIVLAALLFGSADSTSKAVSKASTDSTTMYVNFLSVMLGVFGFAELIKSFISKSYIVTFTKNPKKLAVLICLLILYIWSMQYIGFFIATLLFIPFTLWSMGYKKIVKSIFISLAVTLFVYLLFEKGFEILLPEATIFNGV